MENLPLYVYVTFAITAVAGVWLFVKATNYNLSFLVIILAFILIQSALGIAGFYNNPVTMTTRFPLLIFPFLLFLLSRFITPKGKQFIDNLNVKTLTLFHVIRIPVELVLFWLFVNKSIPQAMTFEGRNFDIFSGVSAPFIYYFGFVKNTLGKPVIIAWNFICIALLLNVVVNAVLSLPARYQQFNFEQPNIALGYFPFLLLPACLVPLVFFANVVSIRQLLKKRANLIPS